MMMQAALRVLPMAQQAQPIPIMRITSARQKRWGDQQPTSSMVIMVFCMVKARSIPKCEKLVFPMVRQERFFANGKEKAQTFIA